MASMDWGALQWILASTVQISHPVLVCSLLWTKNIGISVNNSHRRLKSQCARENTSPTPTDAHCEGLKACEAGLKNNLERIPVSEHQVTLQ